MRAERTAAAVARWMERVCGLLLLGGAMACSDSHPDSEVPQPQPETYPYTPFARMELEEVMESDALTVTAHQLFLYDRTGRLESSTYTQRFTAGDEPFETKQQTTVEYRGRQAVVTDEVGTVSTYVLNSQGYATSCTRRDLAGNTRTYTFTYHTDAHGWNCLKSITERLDEGEVYASITLDYANPQAIRLRQQTEELEQDYTLLIPTGKAEENRTGIPCLFLAERYPLSLHTAALYGKLLGEPWGLLVDQIIPDSNGEGEESITYSYELDEKGFVNTCRETVRHLRSGIAQEYTRTLGYAFE